MLVRELHVRCADVRRGTIGLWMAESLRGFRYGIYTSGLCSMQNYLPRFGILGIGLLLAWTMTGGTCRTGQCPTQSLVLTVARSLGLMASPAVAVATSNLASEQEAASASTPDSTDEAIPVRVAEKSFPRIAGHGGVFPLPDAPHQPRSGTQLCVDMTAGGEAAKLSPAIEKLARYVNIYAGAGREPATLEMVVILHGEATLKALNPESYSSRFETEGNPNLAMIATLREQGAKFYVCGQSLMTLGASPDEVAEGIDVAVSALTCNVNLQQDGYQVVNMH